MEKLLKIINEFLDSIGVEPIASLVPTLNLKKDLEIDSISYAELVVILEETYGININDKGKAETIGDVQERLLN